MVTVGFEPTKRDASDLKSLPFDQTRERYFDYNEWYFFIRVVKVN